MAHLVFWRMTHKGQWLAESAVLFNISCFVVFLGLSPPHSASATHPSPVLHVYNSPALQKSTQHYTKSKALHLHFTRIFNGFNLICDTYEEKHFSERSHVVLLKWHVYVSKTGQRVDWGLLSQVLYLNNYKLLSQTSIILIVSKSSEIVCHLYFSRMFHLMLWV